ncbi:exonuclease domain-containing protein [Amycolatopsis sp. A133]|uniref:exonuclease domain-containing protein n=1 Tax=Amycolatopsis sp. A133 TaxID=3064472 RepID=UPI0027FBB556|nr:exonuclease domain-containing protein [Amycolatopsis sp. A133]MDQ7803932.1 exonuclease domain-containing protein [Amycolatopsis sp. A133]
MIELLPLLAAGGHPAHGVGFTAVDIRTTGLRPGRVVELAAVRVDADGSFAGELSTLVDPGAAIPLGTALVHGITRGELDDAPSFGEVLGPLLDLCAGSVVVTHDPAFTEAFLDREIGLLGVRLPALPGVSTLAAAQSVVRLPNYRPATVAHALGVPTGPSALSGARTIARLATVLFGRYGLTFASPPVFPGLPRFAAGRLLPRAEESAAEPGWMAEAVERIAGGGSGDAYLDLLAGVIADQHLTPDEVAVLAAAAGEAGLTEAQVRSTHEQLVTALRTIAERDGVVTTAEARELRQVATALGVAEAGDLRPSAGGKPTRVLVLGTTVAADRLRARVLAEGGRLAKKLTASVTHLVADATVPADEPRLARATELGAVVLDIGAAPVALGFEPPPAPPAPAKAAVPRLVGGRILMGAGLLLMLVVVLAMFGGTPLAAGIFLAALGVGALLGGWWLAEPAPR